MKFSPDDTKLAIATEDDVRIYSTFTVSDALDEARKDRRSELHTGFHSTY